MTDADRSVTDADPRPDNASGSTAPTDAALHDLVGIMDRLRSPGGCPWDAKQTHASLIKYLIEETYETVDAIESGDQLALREELGDLLLQVVFHSRIAQEDASEPFTINDVAQDIADKLIRRHPHVFGDVSVEGADEVESNWESLKKVEKQRTSALDGVPMAMPALALAAKVLDRSERAGFDISTVLPAVTHDVGLATTAPADEQAWGDFLFALAAQARVEGVDAELALRAAVARFASRVRSLEVRSTHA